MVKTGRVEFMRARRNPSARKKAVWGAGVLTEQRHLLGSSWGVGNWSYTGEVNAGPSETAAHVYSMVHMHARGGKLRRSNTHLVQLELLLLYTVMHISFLDMLIPLLLLILFITLLSLPVLIITEYYPNFNPFILFCTARNFMQFFVHLSASSKISNNPYAVNTNKQKIVDIFQIWFL
jgi:hypothetical protein